jgi:hypothetical protein
LLAAFVEHVYRWSRKNSPEYEEFASFLHGTKREPKKHWGGVAEKL